MNNAVADAKKLGEIGDIRNEELLSFYSSPCFICFFLLSSIATTMVNHHLC